MGGCVDLVTGVSDAVYVCLQGERLGAWGFGPLCGVGSSNICTLSHLILARLMGGGRFWMWEGLSAGFVVCVLSRLGFPVE